MKRTLFVLLAACVFPLMISGQDSKSYLLLINNEVKTKIVKYSGKALSMDSNLCKCGHYTQMIWRATREIGCAVAKRKDIPGYIALCRYSPSGNTIGEKPY